MKLKSIYRSYEDSLRTDFFVPCMREAASYDRAAGYFSSGALRTWALALREVEASTPFRVRLITSPQLSDADIAAVSAMAIPEERAAFARKWGDSMFGQLLTEAAADNRLSSSTDLLAWLLVHGWMQLRIAVPREGMGMYHEKIGIFRLKDGGQVGFVGSANETEMGHQGNGEILVVFSSEKEHDRGVLRDLAQAFEDTWAARQRGIEVYEPSPRLLQQLQARAERWRAFEGPAPTPLRPKRPPPWPHQQEAIDSFLSRGRGILEMATGTGKTRTALEIACRLFGEKKIDSLIVSTDGNDLLRQWTKEVMEWQVSDRHWQRIYREYASEHEAARFLSRPASAVLIIARQNLHSVLQKLEPAVARRTLVIHDEIHGLGAPKKRSDLAGHHAHIAFVLGLSATPEREYDQEGTRFIEAEIGPVLFRFALEDAIRTRILCELDYTRLEYQLTADDKKRIERVWAMKAARAHAGDPMSDEEVAIQISNVYKTAELKPEVFAEYLQRHPEAVRSSIVFVANTAFGEQLLPILQRHTRLYRTYYADDDVDNLRRFSEGEIDCLITCHKLSQGIDIQQLRNVILVSSDRARLETIQRIGRCLRVQRSDPTKRAHVVDFVCTGVPDARNPDRARSIWLSQLSQITGQAQ